MLCHEGEIFRHLAAKECESKETTMGCSSLRSGSRACLVFFSGLKPRSHFLRTPPAPHFYHTSPYLLRPLIHSSLWHPPSLPLSSSLTAPTTPPSAMTFRHSKPTFTFQNKTTVLKPLSPRGQARGVCPFSLIYSQVAVEDPRIGCQWSGVRAPAKEGHLVTGIQSGMHCAT